MGAIPTPGERDCFDNVFRAIAGSVLDRTGYFGANFGRCQDNIYTGSSSGAITGVFCGPCPNIVLIEKKISSNCGSCTGFVSLLANLIHECRHFGQSACLWGRTPDKRTRENDAARFTIDLLKTTAVKLCDIIVGQGVCATPFDCYDELARERKREEAEIED
jgi:hypothetical protein